MARISTKDPLDKFRWSIEITGFNRMGFSSCEVPSVSINVQSYPEGGNHLSPKKIIDSVEYKPVTLQRGVTSDLEFDTWATQFINIHRGAKLGKDGKPIVDEKGPILFEYRKEVRINHLDRLGRIIKTYILYNAFPIEYKPASDFDASTDDGISMEKLVLTYESFEVISEQNQSNNPLDPSDILKRLVKRA